ncbi:hypothetical protein D9M70_545580 [compost metagenome]
MPVSGTPSSSASPIEKPGRSISGTLKVSPSSPPVHSDSCDTSVANAVATASVIIAKKIARTRSENRPIRNASSAETASAPTAPTASAPHPGSIRDIAIATP